MKRAHLRYSLQAIVLASGLSILAASGALVPPGPASGDVPTEVDVAAGAEVQDPPQRRRGRKPSPEEMESIIGVAEDISPEWAASLRSRLADHPENAPSDFRRHGRRLFGLLMLKRQNPDLYRIRVAELALKKGIKDQAAEYHVILTDDPSRAADIANHLKDMVKESVDRELRARAMELEALDTAVRELRDRLLGEVNERESRVETLWKALLDEPVGDDGDGNPFDGFTPGDADDRMRGRPGSSRRRFGSEGERQ